ncbi:MAG TPA: VanW family protein [Acidimicrobiia bacterium]|nr:VanW family protein [Acidimicrobiia bacterium]
MTKQLRFPIHPMLAAAIAVGGVFALLFAAYGITRWVSGGEVMGHVVIAETDLGGLTRGQALSEVRAMEERRLARNATFVVDGNPVTIQPGATGFTINKEQPVDAAMVVGRQGNFINQFLFWLGHMFSTTRLELKGEVDQVAMANLFDAWETEVIAKPVTPGGIELMDGKPVAVYPSEGVSVDRETAADVVLEAILSESPETKVIPTTTSAPELTHADVDAALNEAQLMLSGPIDITYDGNTAVITRDQLTQAFRSETVSHSPAKIINSFDPEVVDTFLTALRAEFEAEPVDAEFVINDNLTVSVKPGKNGTRIDEVETADRLYEASLTPRRTGEIPIVEDAEPDVTTEELEALNVKHLVSQFTTYHSCCEPRVTNIHLMADTIDGALVRPGETFSINEQVGERTLEKGFLPAPSIVAGEIVDTIGGGTSQFATTFYNAVFWGGYEDVSHQPHSYYYSRYPEGIEATLFWGSIDLKFRNNRDHAVLIDTSYTDTSITVRFFGFNDGRTLVGEQSGGENHIRVVSEGGPNALHVKGHVSDRYAITQPGEPILEGNPELAVDEQRTVQKPTEGWSVTITREIYRGGTELISEEEWFHTYRPHTEIIEVNPCKLPDASQPCPTTTTTTTVGTTTATVGTTTTTVP